MTRENKLAIVIGFGLLLFVGILVSDHLSARSAQIATPMTEPVRFEPPSSLPGEPPQPFGSGIDPARPERPTVGRIGIDDGANANVPAGLPGGAGWTRADGMDGTGSATTATTQGQAQERTHTIARGETLGDVAKRYYGKRSLGVKLAEYNKADSSRLKIGQSIKIPDVTVLDPSLAPSAVPAVGAPMGVTPIIADPSPAQTMAPAPSAETPSARKYGTVKVAEGDTLYRIAKRVYGDASRWNEIAALNNLGEGKALKPGRELKYALPQ